MVEEIVLLLLVPETFVIPDEARELHDGLLRGHNILSDDDLVQKDLGNMIILDAPDWNVLWLVLSYAGLVVCLQVVRLKGCACCIATYIINHNI